jgi:hypothetical protein
VSIAARVEQHLADLTKLIDHSRESLAFGIDQLDDEAKSKVEAELTKMKNLYFKLLAYIEKKGCE